MRLLNFYCYYNHSIHRASLTHDGTPVPTPSSALHVNTTDTYV